MSFVFIRMFILIVVYVLCLYPYVVFILYIVHTLLISYLVIGMHTSSLDLKNTCGHPDSKSGIDDV